MLPPCRNKSATATPKEAAKDRPNVKGDARGFLSEACMAVPDPAKIAPITRAARTRLSLKSQITVESGLLSGMKSTLRISSNEALYQPKATDKGTRKKVMMMRHIRVRRFL